MPYYRCVACGLTSYSSAGHASALVCPACDAALTGDAKLYVLPGAQQAIAGAPHNVSRVLLARPDAPASARRALADLPLPATTREHLVLLVTELVTNALRHAGLSRDDRIGVSLINGAGRARLAVHDGGPGFTPDQPGSNDDARAAGGFGLALVDALSNAWGVRSEADGCTVWCEVAVEDHAAL
jgi:anti-sigma regulatory factor (Ser/Thr protein kinase)